jgi:hypothetical protein
MKAPECKPEVDLLGNDGNAFFILGTTKNALKKAGADKEYIDKYIKEATCSNYDKLLQVTMEYVEIA